MPCKRPAISIKVAYYKLRFFWIFTANRTGSCHTWAEREGACGMIKNGRYVGLGIMDDGADGRSAVFDDECDDVNNVMDSDTWCQAARCQQGVEHRHCWI